jgi:hypothetical protein
MQNASHYKYQDKFDSEQAKQSALRFEEELDFESLALNSWHQACITQGRKSWNDWLCKTCLKTCLAGIKDLNSCMYNAGGKTAC